MVIDRLDHLQATGRRGRRRVPQFSYSPFVHRRSRLYPVWNLAMDPRRRDPWLISAEALTPGACSLTRLLLSTGLSAATPTSKLAWSIF